MEKNCLVVKLKAAVNDGSLEPIITDDETVFNMLCANIGNFDTGALGAMEIKVLDDVEIGLVNDGSPYESVDTTKKTYNATSDIGSAYGGFTAAVGATGATSVRVCMKKDDVQNLGNINSVDINLEYIGNARFIKLYGQSDGQYSYHRAFTITDLKLGSNNNLQTLQLMGPEGGFVTGTTAQLASCPSIALTVVYLNNNPSFTGDVALLGKFYNLLTLNLTGCGTSGTIEDFVKAIVNARENAGLTLNHQISIGFDMGGATFNGVAVPPGGEGGINVNKYLCWTVSGNSIDITLEDAVSRDVIARHNGVSRT